MGPGGDSTGWPMGSSGGAGEETGYSNLRATLLCVRREMTLIPYYSVPRLRPSRIYPITRGFPKLAHILSNHKVEIAPPTVELTGTLTNHNLHLPPRSLRDFRPLGRPAGSAVHLYKFPRL